MTIAACFLSPEGVVLGADSTSTITVASADGPIPHYFNFGQKIFEIGIGSTLGILTWGLGSLPHFSHRTLIALLRDSLDAKPATSVREVANRWTELFWAEYDKTYKAECARAKVLVANPNRTDVEEKELKRIIGLTVGFCIGGYILPDRTPRAAVTIFDPRGGKPTPNDLTSDGWYFWGAPDPIKRIMFGVDESFLGDILTSGKWNGTKADLDALAVKQRLGLLCSVPLREAIDFVHASIYHTIKTMKFLLPYQICGGPIEIAVISSDRPFRWVRHKTMGQAIADQSLGLVEA